MGIVRYCTPAPALVGKKKKKKELRQSAKAEGQYEGGAQSRAQLELLFAVHRLGFPFKISLLLLRERIRLTRF